jgi:endonuclease-8
MPEGDVVLRTARRLDAALSGRRLTAAELRWPTIAGVDLVGRTVLETTALGKHLLTRFDDGRTLHTHLRMDGRWQVERTGPPRQRSAAVRAVLVGTTWTCVGIRLGMMDVVQTRDEHRILGHLGPDVLAPQWDTAAAVRRLRAEGARAIGAALLDQRVVAGVGTIYMAEALWVHGVSPWTPVTSVRDPGAVLDTARALMQRSVAARVPTATGDVRPGRTSNVHGRATRPCPRCGTPVEVRTVGEPPTARPAFFCPRCQRL